MAFGTGAAGRGEPLRGDTVQDPGNPVPPYGEAVTGRDLRLGEDGMTCTNAEGHGFSVAKGECCSDAR